MEIGLEHLGISENCVQTHGNGFGMYAGIDVRTFCWNRWEFGG